VRRLTARLLEARVAPAHRNAPAPSEYLTDSCGRYRAVCGANGQVWDGNSFTSHNESSHFLTDETEANIERP